MQQRKIVAGGKIAGQVAANEGQRTFLRSLVEELGAAGAARRTNLNQLTLMRVLAGLPVLRGTLSLVDAARSRATEDEGPHAA